MDISAGTELVLGKREPLNLQDMFGDSTSADERSDRETGKWGWNKKNILYITINHPQCYNLNMICINYGVKWSQTFQITCAGYGQRLPVVFKKIGSRVQPEKICLVL